MTTGLVVALVIALLIVLLTIRTPVWLALAASGAVGLFLLRDEVFVTRTLASAPFEQTSSFSLTIIPMFILMGIFAVKARIAGQVFEIARRVFVRFPGGLGISTVAACAGFAAVSGSSIGTAATMSRLSIGEMRKAGYPASLAGALVAMAGTLGAMIPPSVFL
ncbi:MAG TPA: TRAP transporter large permease subunit, partial [Citricoccus sp.]